MSHNVTTKHATSVNQEHLHFFLHIPHNLENYTKGQLSNNGVVSYNSRASTSSSRDI